jgi:hypothetical protein
MRSIAPLLAGALALAPAVPLALVAAAPASASAATAKRCNVPSAKPLGTAKNYLRTIYRSPDVSVIEHVTAKPVGGRSDVVSLAYRACSRATGRQRLIYAGSPGTGPFPEIGFDARGNWLVYGHFIGSGQITQDSGTVHSLNVRTGARGPLVNQVAGAVAGSDGLIPDVGQAYTQLAIADDGQYAWVTDTPAVAGNPTTPTTGLFAPAAANGDRAIDPEAPSAVTDLTVHGQTITWVVGAKTETAVLP